VFWLVLSPSAVQSSLQSCLSVIYNLQSWSAIIVVVLDNVIAHIVLFVGIQSGLLSHYVVSAVSVIIISAAAASEDVLSVVIYSTITFSLSVIIINDEHGCIYLNASVVEGPAHD